MTMLEKRVDALESKAGGAVQVVWAESGETEEKAMSRHAEKAGAFDPRRALVIRWQETQP